MSGQGQPRYRTMWSRVQVVVLAITVVFCIVMLVTGAVRELDPVFAVAAIFFGIAMVGHATFLWWVARSERRP